MKAQSKCDIAFRGILVNHEIYKDFMFFVVPALGMAWCRDPVFHAFFHPSTFATTLASILLFGSV